MRAIGSSRRADGRRSPDAKGLATALAVLAAGLALTGCGNDELKPPRVPTLNIKLSEYDLEPAKLKVDKPGTVFIVVRNNGDNQHVLELDGPNGGAQKTDVIDPGAGATLRADLSEPGRYAVYCPLDDHRQRGMRGTISVGKGRGG